MEDEPSPLPLVPPLFFILSVAVAVTLPNDGPVVLLLELELVEEHYAVVQCPRTQVGTVCQLPHLP